MKKEKGDDDSSVGWTYGGKEEEWDSFDRRMMRYMRKKLDSFGEKLWTGEIVDIAPLEKKKFGDYVLEVYKALRITQPREAKELIKKNSDFFKKAWHEQWLARQANLMVDHIEDHAVGQAEVEVVNYSGDKKMIRLHLYKQFGAGSGGDIHSQELEYEKGMPDGNGVAFRPGMDITVKLRQLEGRKIYFWKMCEPAKRKKYVFCQETKLVRIVLEHINDDYKTCVDRLLDYVKVKKLVDASSKGKASSSFTDLPNSLDRSFNDDWLPSWANLQACLIEEYSRTNLLKFNTPTWMTHPLSLPINAPNFKPLLAPYSITHVPWILLFYPLPTNSRPSKLLPQYVSSKLPIAPYPTPQATRTNAQHFINVT